MLLLNKEQNSAVCYLENDSLKGSFIYKRYIYFNE